VHQGRRIQDRSRGRTAAGAHLPVLERYHRGLYDELVGIAEARGVAEIS